MFVCSIALSKFPEASDVEDRKYCPWSFMLIPSFKKAFELIYNRHRVERDGASSSSTGKVWQTAYILMRRWALRRFQHTDEGIVRAHSILCINVIFFSIYNFLFVT